MHNVISSCFFLSGEQSWAEGGVEEGCAVGGGLYVGGCGGSCWCREVILFSVPVSHFFDFLLMLSIYFADCVSTLWSQASEIFGVLVVRYFYGEKRRRQYMRICVCTHTPPSVFVSVCVWGMLMGVQTQQRRLLHHIYLILGGFVM